MTDRSAAYRERLYVPVGWWFLAVLFCASLALAAGWYLGVAAALVGGLVPLVSVAALFLSYGRATVAVDAGGLTAGRARIAPEWIAAVAALDPGQSRERRGPRADVHAYLVLRPYLAAAVEVTLADPADPAPYWLISSRRPQQLAAALGSVLLARSVDSAGPIDPVGSSE